jgi:putative DNA methylase
MSYAVKAPKKLIEVALPLDAINVEAAREKSIRHGHPSTLHLWWARRPLAAARAVIFAQMVNDPSWKWEMEHPGEIPPNHLKASWAKSRKRLFAIVEELVKWENTTNGEVLEKARVEIRRSWRETCELNRDHPRAAELFDPEKLPGFHDPFAGGGAIPLEAQRLGLASHASDLNPVAVLINKAMIEIPPRFQGRAPVGPPPDSEKRIRLDFGDQWKGATGLAEDVRRYGALMREEAQQRIGHLYPQVQVTAEMAEGRQDLEPLIGKELTVIAWLWARTVKSPNPAFRHVDVPLASTFMLSTKVGKPVYIEPVLKGDTYQFQIRDESPSDDEATRNGTKLSRGANFRCLMSNTPIPSNYIYSEANSGHMGAKLMAIVADSEYGRVYLPPTPEMEAIALQARPQWKPEVAMPENPRWFSPPLYGLKTFGDLFTTRQLVALNTFSDLVLEVRARVERDAATAGMPDDGRNISVGGSGAAAYADAVSIYLAIALSRLTDICNSLCRWEVTKTQVRNLFGRQAIPMLWDFAENNVFGDAAGDYAVSLSNMAKALEKVPASLPGGIVTQADAQNQSLSEQKVVSTDPPYYDNIGYADLSDFFYVWLRRTLRTIYPDLFATIAVPKAEELVATPYRHGSSERAEAFFMSGMTDAMHRLTEQAHPSFPTTIYYAFKQSETNGSDGTTSTGWETFLDAVIRAGFALTGTWPMRTELANRMIGSGTNALASSIVLVCRPRPQDAITISRRAFIRELNQILPEALDEMTRGSGGDRSPVAPVDLSQAIIGPGMAVFSKYSAVLEADGTPMTVQTALRLINRFLAEDDFDPDTQFCLHWFEQHGWNDSRFGDADTLARAKGTSVDGVKQSGVVQATGGVVRLLRWADYPGDWEPETDIRLPVWEVLHQLIRVFRTQGEAGAGEVLAAVATKAEATRQLAYRLYTLCERAGWAEDARAYNEIITSWSAIESAATKAAGPKQASLFDA